MRNVGERQDVRSYIRGYVRANDVTARDLQKTDGQWTRAKGFDTFCPLGPIVSEEVDPWAGVELETKVNGVRKQHGNTKDFIFSPDRVIRYISSIMTLYPGDLILTGTPAGVAPLQDGDTVEVSISGIGQLKNSVRA
jgi:2-keto-4-pentenoate hydratase/2-oxohepta-3-ene-1,7-dioic acid hydratase in catechol pathway